jgi:hypothetical protein
MILVWCVVVMCVVLSMLLLVIFFSTPVEGSFSDYNIYFEPNKTVYFNAEGVISRIVLNGESLPNPYLYAPRDTGDLGDKVELLLTEPRVIQSSSVSVGGSSTFVLTGYDNGGVSLTSKSSKTTKISVRVYGTDVYYRSNSLNAILSMRGQPILPNVSSVDLPFMKECAELENTRLCLSQNFVDIKN